MRPEIPDNMAERIRQLDGYHGYQNVSEFVRDATRERLQVLEGKAGIVESADEYGLNIDMDDIYVGESNEERLKDIERLLQEAQEDRSEGMVNRIERLEGVLEEVSKSIERIEQEV